MRITSSLLVAALGSVTFALAGCSSGSASQSYGPPTPSAGKAQSTSFLDDARSGRSLLSVALPQFPPLALHDVKPPKNRHLNDLYVSDFSTVLVLKNGSYKSAGAITKGLVTPNGVFVDATGNFYVADFDGVDIREYKPKGRSPSFTYKNSMIDPINVSVDRQGNVYEADYDGWYVNEYAQKSNTVMNSCAPGGSVEGAAVDANGDVFVDYNESTSGSGKIAEYEGGLAGCHETVLNVALDFAGGMAIDAQNNLIVVDQTAPAVDVIPPPYSSITGTLGSGFYVAPFHVTLDKNNKRAFVSDLYDVFVVGYPSGSLLTSLGSAYGWKFPAGAVDSANAVY